MKNILLKVIIIAICLLSVGCSSQRYREKYSNGALRWSYNFTTSGLILETVVKDGREVTYNESGDLLSERWWDQGTPYTGTFFEYFNSDSSYTGIGWISIFHKGNCLSKSWVSNFGIPVGKYIPFEFKYDDWLTRYH
jgi:hypothetical protein